MAQLKLATYLKTDGDKADRGVGFLCETDYFRKFKLKVTNKISQNKFSEAVIRQITDSNFIAYKL